MPIQSPKFTAKASYDSKSSKNAGFSVFQVKVRLFKPDCVSWLTVAPSEYGRCTCSARAMVTVVSAVTAKVVATDE